MMIYNDHHDKTMNLCGILMFGARPGHSLPDLAICAQTQYTFTPSVCSEPNNDYHKDYHYDLDDHVDDK